MQSDLPEKGKRFPLGWVGAAILLSLPAWGFDPFAADAFAVVPWIALLVSALTATFLWRNPRPSPVVLLGLLPALASMAFISLGAKPFWAAAAWGAWFLLAELTAPTAVSALRWGVLGGACANALFMLAQAAGFDPLFSPLPAFAVSAHGAQNVTGFLGNAAAAAIFLVLSMPLAAVIPRRFRLSFQLLILTAILLSGSRVPLLMALAILVIDLWSQGRKRRAMALVATVLAAAALYGPLRARTYDGLVRGTAGRQLKTRLSEWKIAGSILSERPAWQMAGLGEYGNTERAAREERAAAVPRGHGWFRHAHNDFLETLVEAGWLGGLLYAAAFGYWLRERRLDAMAKVSLAVFAGLMLIQDPLHRPAALLALAASLAGATRLREMTGSGPRFTQRIFVATVMAGAFAMGADTVASRGWLAVTPATLSWFPESGRTRLIEVARETVNPVESLPLWEAALAVAPDPEAALAVARIQDRTGTGSPRETLCKAWLVTGSIVLERQLRAWNIDPLSGCWLSDKAPAMIKLD